MDTKKTYNPNQQIKDRLKEVQDRIRVMEQRKKDLAINAKCDRMDALFTPHKVSLDNPNVIDDINSGYYTNFEYENKQLLLGEDKRKSKPLAFEKITTAIASLIKEIPKAKARPFKEEYRDLNAMVEANYYENWEANRLVKQLKRFTFDLAKYGIAYGRRYYKKTYRTIRNKEVGLDGSVKETKQLSTLVDDVLWESINPRWVLLDDACMGPYNANDEAIIEYLDENTFKSRFPVELYPEAQYVKPGQSREILIDSTGQRRIKLKTLTGDLKDKIQVLTYQNLLKDSEEIIANGVYLEEHILPGHTLSIFGAKWIDDKEDYDGIGVGQIVELYQPLVDDILNSSNERLRQLVRPVRVMGNDVKVANDEDFIWKSGAEMRVEGDLNQVKWDRPPVTSNAELNERTLLDEEIDISTFIPKALGGLDVSETAYQAAQNREAALKKLSLPLDNIKDALEDDANIAFRLFKEVYSQPIETKILTPDNNEDFMMAQSEMAKNPDDDRFVAMEDGSIAYRKFREKELPLVKELKEENGKLIDTGKVVEVDEKEFWEMIPEHFNWEGYINIEPMSFLPTSEMLDIEQKKDRANFLLNIPDTDEIGNPVLKDENGLPYRINKVQAVKDYVDATKANPDKYVVQITEQSQVAGDMQNSSESEDLTPKEQVGLSRPEVESEMSSNQIINRVENKL